MFYFIHCFTCSHSLTLSQSPRWCSINIKVNRTQCPPPRSHNPTLSVNSSSRNTTSIELPWECTTTQSLALITTSYDAAQIIDFDTEVIPNSILVTIDSTTTVIPTFYNNPGQFVFIKPWGDEDGLCKAYPIWTKPCSDADSCMVVVPRNDIVADSVVNGELLEISAVFGNGFVVHENEKENDVSYLGVTTLEYLGVVCAAVGAAGGNHVVVVVDNPTKTDTKVDRLKSCVDSIQSVDSITLVDFDTLEFHLEQHLESTSREQDATHFKLVVQSDSPTMTRIQSAATRAGIPRSNIVFST